MGISNWALDPAKMNRGIMVVRGNPDVPELERSAREICSDKEADPVRDRLEAYFRPLAESYNELCTQMQQQKEREFYGLRDFYR